MQSIKRSARLFSIQAEEKDMDYSPPGGCMMSTIDCCHLMSSGVTPNSLTAGVSVAFSLVVQARAFGAAELISDLFS